MRIYRGRLLWAFRAAQLLVFCSLFTTGLVQGQITPSNDTGVRAGQTYDGTNENVNLSNGNLNLSIPLVSLPGRNGMSYPLALQYDSKIWTSEVKFAGGPGGTDVLVHWRQNTGGASGGWRFNLPSVTAGDIIYDDNGYHTDQGPYIIQLPGGGTTSIVYDYPGTTADSQDGSFVSLAHSGNNTQNGIPYDNGLDTYDLWEKDGSLVHMDASGTKITDTNGNYISIAGGVITAPWAGRSRSRTQALPSPRSPIRTRMV